MEEARESRASQDKRERDTRDVIARIVRSTGSRVAQGLAIASTTALLLVAGCGGLLTEQISSHQEKKLSTPEDAHLQQHARRQLWSTLTWVEADGLGSHGVAMSRCALGSIILLPITP